MCAALAHPRATLLLGATATIEDEEDREGEPGEPAEAEEQRADLCSGAAILVFAAAAGHGMGEPDGCINTEAEGASAMFILVEPFDDGELSERARLSCLTEDLWLEENCSAGRVLRKKGAQPASDAPPKVSGRP